MVIFRLRAGFDATERMDVQGQQDGESVVKRRPTLDITSVPLMETTPPPSTSYSGEELCVGVCLVSMCLCRRSSTHG